MKHVLLIFTLLFLAGCTNDSVNSDKKNTTEETTDNNQNGTDAGEPTEQNESDEVAKEDVDYTKFFMPDDSTAYFLGEGNEYAAYTVHTKWLSDHYVALVEDNGGAAKLKIYRVMDENDKIDKVYDEIIEGLPNEVQYPSVEKLNSLPLIETYLNGPLNVGTVIGNWKITQVGTTLDTPYQTFDHVFVLEETTEDFINRKYFVEGFGEVKRESIMHIEGEEDFIVTSTLEKIESGK